MRMEFGTCNIGDFIKRIEIRRNVYKFFVFYYGVLCSFRYFNRRLLLDVIF